MKGSQIGLSVRGQQNLRKETFWLHHEFELKDVFTNEMMKMKSAVFGTVLQEYYIYAVPQCLLNFLHVELY